ncbi:glycosyltransferase family 2 protein [Zwartia panacis]|uniref:glycosyltransferase family 2 protein n=1 Tax=Zwartia panacis TaxID=2683345 RepID=UPI0025B428BC|nr:glycosyltransferase family 2 protein [Zwartia panacis]MDN4018309.1 glycosyltransferase family 2 protein [Zwartia panacis]
MFENKDEWRVAVVIPAYRVTQHISEVIHGIPESVWGIYVVDDACPDETGKYVETFITDPRVRVLYQPVNQGVGGAVMAGYQAALADKADIIVKVDGDGQMDPALIPDFIAPIISGEADYTKGNRFYDLEKIRSMPRVRIFGNAVLSLLTKLSSGYWNLFDPTNGYTAIHADACKHLPFHKISKRYFFETDMLFRLNTLRAMVVDVPMDAKYGEETSHLKISKIMGEFLYKHTKNFCKRIFYNYFLRDLSLASIQLVLGFLLTFFGVVFGGYQWLISADVGIPASAGTVMVAAMPLLIGLQLILSFIGYDIASVPRRPIHRLKRRRT